MKIEASADVLKLELKKIETVYVPKKQCHNNEILLTGASGFLGVHLLADLVSLNCFDKIYVIVRNKNKLLTQLMTFDLPLNIIDSIIVIESDLHTLSDKDFPDVQYVIHGAAQIHCLKTLKQLWHDNVLLTHKICSIYQHNQVHFISTLSVFVSSNQKGIHHAKLLSEEKEYLLYGGYAQSKFLGEKIAEQYNHSIIRLGLLTGSTKKGLFPHDFFVDYVQTLYMLGVYPENIENAWVDITPVDICSQKVIRSLFQDSKITHIANKQSLSIYEIVNMLGLQQVTRDQWNKNIAHLPSLIRFLLNFSFFKQKMLQSHFQYFNLDLFQSTGHNYDIQESFNVDNKTLLSLYVKNLTKELKHVAKI